MLFESGPPHPRGGLSCYHIVVHLIAFAALLAVAPASAAETCDQARQNIKAELTSRLKLDARRNLARTVQAGLTPAEAAEFASLSARFNAIPHAGDGIEERFALQARARVLTRAATARAGHPPRNPANGSPYDAVVEETESADGLVETVVELRSLLVLRDPRPHVTVWLQRNDPAHNPWNLVTVGVAADPGDDYASWRGPDRRRVVGTFAAFVETRLPAACR